MKNIKFTHIIYILILIFLAYSFAGSLKLFFKARQNLSDAQKLLEAESAQNTKLHNDLSQVGKQIYVEKIARDTLGLAHENEVVFVLPPEDELKKLSPRIANNQPNTQNVDQKPHWQEWLELFN